MVKGLSAEDIVIPAAYKEVFLDKYDRFILSSGRISGKTSVLVALWWATINKNPDKDIVILHATQTEIKESIINEIKAFLRNTGVETEYDIPESATTIKKRDKKGITYFYPITDYKGGQRTRGVNTVNPISLVLYEECQKNKDANVVEQSIATFVRQLDKGSKIVIVGNNEAVGHWFIDFVQNKINEDWHYIYANCFDIWDLLTDETKKYIEEFKNNNPIEFKRIFLGDIYASASDVVFPQFKRKEHYKTVNELDEKYIVSIIVGIDHATANDTFAVVPIAILDDGTTQTLEIMYSDPDETNATLAPTEQCELLDNFLNFLDEKYGIVYNNLPTYLSIDGAASPFIAQVNHTKRTSYNRQLWKQIKVSPFTMKKKDINMGIIKNAFAYGVLTILNEGATMWNGMKNVHRLRNEIEKQRYKGITRKLDPAIKNDLVDALEYGLIPYYINSFNISFPVRKNNDKSKRKEIMALAKKK